MRIITGSAKGAKLKAPRGLETRPTTDRVKESVFNILSGTVVDACVLDLFAGTGNLGLEALSRGAKQAVFVDRRGESVTVIKDNAEHTKLSEHAKICKKDVLAALDEFDKSGQNFTMIFCDPPYNHGFVASVLKKIDEGTALQDSGIIVIEHSQHELVAEKWLTLAVRRTEKYGETLVSFLVRHTT
ncbi:MAG: 16S rRNA (guanine(966)-N(2))-methyltransferase RsmD [Pelosinus sp.]|nr:16S rRNA (guanine(966)-N(2))-methyltransferase RsmD [Pelosinus sp.]